MPKKKKKSRASTGGISTISVVNKSSPSVSKPDVLQDCTALQIISSSTPPNKTLKYSPSIVLTVEDADNLGVLTGDSVILLSVVNLDSVKTSTVASVYVNTNSSPPSASKSPTTVKTQRSKLSPGFCHVFPSSLARRLQCQTEQEESATILPQSAISSTTSSAVQSLSTPSPSKAKFSFARGGGGDKLISSPSTPRTPQPQGRWSIEYELWVVPIESFLGDLIRERICHKAQAITIQTKSTVLQRSRVGRLLVQAHLSSSFLSVDMDVDISVQGVTSTCQISSIQPSLEVPIDKQFEKLSITENEISDLDSESKALIEILRKHESKSSIHLYEVTHDTQVTFEGTKTNEYASAAKEPPKSLVAGLDSTFEKVMESLLTPLRHPKLFQSSSSSVLRPPRGVLVHGSSGSGKTLLLRQISEQLKFHHKFDIKEISCSKLQAQTSLVGEAEQDLVRQFEAASQYKERPAKLVILDDIHLICPRRQGSNAGSDRLASTLLALLDGINSNESTALPVMVLAATNNPGLLDPALRRPGRLDVEVEVPLPDEPSTRSEILQFQLRSFGANMGFDESSKVWLDIARLAKGFTGADLELAVKEAIRLSKISGENAISLAILENAIRSVKPSAIKTVTVEIPKVLWSSIGGMEEVKRQLREAIELPLTHGDMFKQLGIRPPRGVMLYGPPGCSKTLMARALATEGQMNFLAVKGPELLSKWLGESERALASLFRRARLASPSVIFFDEVDAIATKRGGGSSGGGERLLSQLLTELDGIQSGNGVHMKQRVVVVCATNRPDLIDLALMRPGRIDRMIYVGVPDIDSRRRILEIGLKEKACDESVDIDVLAEEGISGGLSGAELISACRDAALATLEESEMGETTTMISQPSISMRHMVEALQNTERQITQETLDFYMAFQGKSNIV